MKALSKIDFKALSTKQITEIYARLQEFLDFNSLSMHKFGARVGIAPGGISRAMSSEGEYSMGIDKFLNIFNGFPDLNPAWLLFGEGEMIEDKILRHGPAEFLAMEKEIHTLRQENTILKAKQEAFIEMLQALGKKE